MKKITRSGLKSVVKECLIEILAEGLSESRTSSLNESRSRKHPGKFSQTKSSEPARRRPSLDQISFEQPPDQTKFDKRISNTVNSMTDDSVLSSILEDTARTTLQEQITAESQRGMNSHAQGDQAAKAVASADPMELFSGASNKWAELAFATPKNRP